MVVRLRVKKGTGWRWVKRRGVWVEGGGECCLATQREVIAILRVSKRWVVLRGGGEGDRWRREDFSSVPM